MTSFSLLVNESPVDEVSDPKKQYSMWNSGSVECEVGEFLMGLVRLTKPKEILETGCYKGWSTAYMANGLKENGFGHLTAVEFDSQHVESTKKLLTTLNLLNYVTIACQSSLTFETNSKYDLIFLDTEPNIRFPEFIKFYDNLNEGGYLFIHDLFGHMSQEQSPGLEFGWPFGVLPEQTKKWVREDKLRPFHFSTPRGFTGFYKTKKSDYNWRGATDII